MKFVAPVAAIASMALVANTIPVAAEQQLAPGQWQTTALTKENEALLWVSLKDVSGYQPGVNKYICVKDVQSVATQQVFGTNYLFTTMACQVNNWFEIGYCKHAHGLENCNAVPTQVQLNINSTTMKLQVNRIQSI